MGSIMARRRRARPLLQSEVERPSKLTAAQFDYAWKWFNFHADQRTKMFNFMLITFGFLFAAIANTFEKAKPVAIAVCAFGVLLAFIFSRLDKRNQQLLSWGEDILHKLESADLYKIFLVPKRSDDRIWPSTDQEVQGGMLYRQKLEDDIQEKKDTCAYLKKWRGIFGGRHRYLLRGIMYVFAVVYCIIGFLLYRCL